MATTPNFAATPRASIGQLSTGDTSRTAPTSVATVFTAGSSGSRIDEIDITATGTTTSNVVRLFLYNGSTYFLLQEVLITAITPSASVPVYTTSITFNNLMLPSGYSLRATTNNTETYNVTAFGGDF